MYLKYCGFTRRQDIEAAIQCDVSAIGFITYPKSARYVNLETLHRLSKQVPDDIDRVAVAVNASMQTLQNIVEQTNINTLQFHGDESVETLRTFKKRYPQIQVFKALPADDMLRSHMMLYRDAVDKFLIDTPSQQFGGTGEVFDWSYLNDLSEAKYLIAGGLNTQNVAQLLKTHTHIDGIDIASGIEIDKGIKDPIKMKQMCAIVKGAIR
ncbi:phosphoribosylanthranilate isomerase [Staphylococcus schleiferi]|uniref:phosphoribosylanthranilate isomerase n=1 Tax=Staphylococcus schleiferi TaxID=1295 RepID=UPI00242FB395|nr:phosphoribosylanthranilate isomerase [Staphylococcus schleiferi]